jgi:hypothetical protein
MQKRPSWQNQQRPSALAIEDPQEAGRDIASGSFRIADVRPSSLFPFHLPAQWAQAS